MPRRTTRKPHEPDHGASSPAQQDEADIVAEVGAERDEESGELVVDEESVLAVGAVDADSVRENRRLRTIVDKKRGNQKNVPFNASDLFTKYETLIKWWPPNTLNINVKRLTGTPIQRVISSCPRSGAELYEALRVIHGQSEEANYEIKFFDTNGKEFRGTCQITMPDARSAPPQGPNMQPYYPNGMPPAPPGYPQAPVYAVPVPVPAGYPPGYPPPGYVQQQPPPQQPQQAQPQQQAPAQAPQPQQQQPMQPPQVFVQQPPPPPAFDPTPMITMMNQMFGMFEQMRAAAQPPPAPVAPAPQYPPTFMMPLPPPQPAPQPMMPPPPSPHASPQEQMAWMQEAFRLFQQMQPAQQPAAPSRGGREAPQAPNMTAMGMPPAQPPPGMIFVPGIGYVAFDALMRAMSGQQGAPQQERPYRPPYQRPYGYPQGDPNAPSPYGGPPGPGPGQGPGPGYDARPPYSGPHSPYGSHAQQQPPRQQTSAEQLRDALTTVRTAVDAVHEIDALLPGRREAPAEIVREEEDDSPIQVIETGPAKIVINRKDGTMRGWETAWSNMPDLLKWAGEQREAIQKSANERQRAQQQPPRQLADGYVEVGPGYQPPPGFVAVPVEQPAPQYHQAPPQPQYQQDLPPPPAHVPPPIQSVPAPPPGRRTWGAPTIPPTEGQT